MERSELSIRLRALALYRDLLSDPVVEAVCTCLDCLENGWPAQVIAAYGELVSRLYAADPPDMGLHIRRIAEDCETAYLRLLSRGERPPETMERCLTAELETLQAAAGRRPGGRLGGGVEAGG